jgi:hypothetical protein
MREKNEEREREKKKSEKSEKSLKTLGENLELDPSCSLVPLI